MKKVLMIILVISISLFSTCFAKSGVEVPEDIRVGIYYNSSAKSSITLSSPGGIEIGLMSDGEFEYIDEVGVNKEITISKSSSSTYGVYVSSLDDTIGTSNKFPYFKSISKNGESIISINGKKYRGNVEIRRISGSDMTVINHLSMQEYLYGVVPREIGGNSEIEAVKAQAIVARTYAAKNYGKRMGLGFDVYPTVDDQAYGGYEWEVANSNKAVDETYGQVVTYKGELIGGYYFSTSGGYTENSENVWGNEVDYLKAVPDIYEPEIEGNTTWTVTMTADEVKASLKKNGIDVGDIIDLVPTKFSDAGRVLEVKVIGTNGEDVVTKSRARSYFGLKSQWYSINDDAPVVKSFNALATNQIVVNDEPEDEPAVEPVIQPKEEIEEPQYGTISAPTQEVITEEETTSPSKEVKVEEVESGEKVGSGEVDNTGEIIVIVDDEGNTIIKKSGKEQHIIIDNFVSQPQEKDETFSKSNNIFATIVSFINGRLFASHEVGFKRAEMNALAGSTKTTFTFRGRGWGHAIGMSQNGAKGMAQNGFSAEEIIKWYYSGVTIEG